MKKSLFCSLILISTALFAGNPGALKWSAFVGMPNLTVSPGNDKVYVGSSNGQLIALNSADGTTAWHTQFAGGIYSPAAYDYNNNIVYVTINANSSSDRGGIYALDGDSGALINSMPVPGDLCQFGRPAQADNPRTGTTDKPVAYSLYCTSSGIEYTAIAEFSANYPQFSPLLEYEQLPYDPNKLDSYKKKEIVFDNNPNPLYSNLEGILTVSYGTLPESSVSIGPAIADWNIMAAQSTASNSRFWQGAIIPNATFSTPTYDRGFQLVYIGGSDGNLYAYAANSQGLNTTPVFTLQLGGDLSQNPTSITDSGWSGGHHIYTTSTNGNLYVVNITQSPTSNQFSATIAWQTHLSDVGFSSRPIMDTMPGGGAPLAYTVDKAGTIYGTIDRITAGEPQTWSPIQNLQINSMSSIMEYDGFNHLLYLTSNNGMVYAFIGATG